MRRDRRERLDALRTGDGRVVPPHMFAQIVRELDRLELVITQVKELEAERDAVLASDASDRPMAMLTSLKGFGAESAAILTSEGLFRHFDNRCRFAAYAGLAPPPWHSGSSRHKHWGLQSGQYKAANRDGRNVLAEATLPAGYGAPALVS